MTEFDVKTIPQQENHRAVYRRKGSHFESVKRENSKHIIKYLTQPMQKF